MLLETPIIPVPSLSVAGWVTAPADKASLLMSHFFEAEKSQTLLYGDKVTSLPWLVQQYGHNIIAMTQQLRTSLEVYLARYYEGASVEVTPKDDGGTRYELQVYIQVTQNGKPYSVGKLLQVNNSKIQKIISLNNNGASA